MSLILIILKVRTILAKASRDVGSKPKDVGGMDRVEIDLCKMYIHEALERLENVASATEGTVYTFDEDIED